MSELLFKSVATDFISNSEVFVGIERGKELDDTS